MIGSNVASLPGGRNAPSNCGSAVWAPWLIHGSFSFFAFSLGQGGYFMLFYIPMLLINIALVIYLWFRLKPLYSSPHY